MVDTFQTNETVVADEAKSSGVSAFLASSTGRIILGALALLVLAIVVGGLLFVFVLSPGGDGLDGAAQAPGSVPTTAPVEPGAAPTYRRTRPLSSTFVFRDVFRPTVKPVFKAAAGSGSGTSTAGSGGTGTGTGGTGPGGTGGTNADGTPRVPDNTLYLKSVSTKDGEQVATFVWNGKTYTVSEGERLGDTPWRLVSIEGNSVVMLYGDTRVTLTIGQGRATTK